MDQATEAEFGLFRYLSYFAQGLPGVEQLIWRAGISRLFSMLLEQSFFWNPKNRNMIRGPAHFFVYSILNSVSALKMISGSDALLIHDQLISDIINAIQTCPDSFVHLNIYLQLQLINCYESVGAEEASKQFVEYLKNEMLIKRWKNIFKAVLNHSLQSIKSQQIEEAHVLDHWSLADIESKLIDFPKLCRDSLKFFECSARPAFLNFMTVPNKILLCAIKIEKRMIHIGDQNRAVLAIFNNSAETFIIESIGMFFNNDSFEPVVFDMQSPLNLQPFAMSKLETIFSPDRASEGPLCVAFVTMQLKQPYVSIQFNASDLLFSDTISNVSWNSCVSEDGFKFMSFVGSILKRNILLTVSKINPSLLVEFKVQARCYKAVPVPVQVVIVNTTNQPIVGEIMFSSETFSIIQDQESKLLQHAVKFNIDASSQILLPIFAKVFDDSTIIASVTNLKLPISSL